MPGFEVLPPANGGCVASRQGRAPPRPVAEVAGYESLRENGMFRFDLARAVAFITVLSHSCHVHDMIAAGPKMSFASFDDRVAFDLDKMSPAEQRVARLMTEAREEVLVASAASLAEKAETSDAT